MVLKEKLSIHDLHGSIIGNEYCIDTFDSYGIRTLRTHGKQIDVDNNIIKETEYNNEGGYTAVNELSPVITVTIDGKQFISCGDTCVFYDTGLKPEHEFCLNSTESGASGLSDVALISGIVNSVKNKFEKPMVVIIKSQTGAPIYAFSGENVCWDAQKDLPKFAKLTIDGKAIYIHRANFQIIDKALLD